RPGIAFRALQLGVQDVPAGISPLSRVPLQHHPEVGRGQRVRAPQHVVVWLRARPPGESGRRDQICVISPSYAPYPRTMLHVPEQRVISNGYAPYSETTRHMPRLCDVLADNASYGQIRDILENI